MPLRRFLSSLLCMALLFAASAASAASADDLQKNAQLLRTAEDFRVRTQAALALGASRSKKAVVPLCQGIRDPHRVVRIASATALSRLDSGGAGCVRGQMTKEKDAKVLAALKKALLRLEGGGSNPAAEPAIGSSTTFYVAIDKLAGPSRYAGAVRAAFVRGIGKNPAVAVAPAKETTAQATAVLSKHPTATGFMLTPKAHKPVYEGGVLKLKLSVAILSYPDKAIVGTFSQNLSMGGVNGPDAKAEEELLLAAAESAMKKFLQLAPTLVE